MLISTRWIPYARHYKPRLVYFFTPFPKTIYVLWPLALCMACIQERLLIKNGLWWPTYGTWFHVQLNQGHFATADLKILNSVSNEQKLLEYECFLTIFISGIWITNLLFLLVERLTVCTMTASAQHFFHCLQLFTSYSTITPHGKGFLH